MTREMMRVSGLTTEDVKDADETEEEGGDNGSYRTKELLFLHILDK